MDLFAIAEFLRSKGIKKLEITSDMWDNDHIAFTFTETYGSETHCSGNAHDEAVEISGNSVVTLSER